MKLWRVKGLDTMTKQQLLRMAEFDEGLARTYADLVDPISGESKGSIFAHFLAGAYQNGDRLMHLISALVESREEMRKACSMVVKLWDQDAPADMVDEPDVKLCRAAYLADAARMKGLKC